MASRAPHTEAPRALKSCISALKRATSRKKQQKEKQMRGWESGDEVCSVTVMTLNKRLGFFFVIVFFFVYVRSVHYVSRHNRVCWTTRVTAVSAKFLSTAIVLTRPLSSIGKSSRDPWSLRGVKRKKKTMKHGLTAHAQADQLHDNSALLLPPASHRALRARLASAAETTPPLQRTASAVDDSAHPTAGQRRRTPVPLRSPPSVRAAAPSAHASAPRRGTPRERNQIKKETRPESGTPPCSRG